jgi:hypothetical protein
MLDGSSKAQGIARPILAGSRQAAEIEAALPPGNSRPAAIVVVTTSATGASQAEIPRAALSEVAAAIAEATREPIVLADLPAWAAGAAEAGVVVAAGGGGKQS